MAILSQTIAIPIWAAVVSIVAIVAIAVLLRGLETKRQIAAVLGIAALLAAVSGAIVSSDRAPLASSAPLDRPVGATGGKRSALDAEEAKRAERAPRAEPSAPSARAAESAPTAPVARSAPPAPQVPVMTAPLTTTPTAISTATMALAGSDLAPKMALSAETSPPLPRTQPPPPEANASSAMAAVSPATERPAAPVEQSDASEASPARRVRGVVPPVASVLPDLEFPSSDSIPPVSIMNSEPKPPAADPAPSASSTVPKPPPRPK